MRQGREEKEASKVSSSSCLRLGPLELTPTKVVWLLIETSKLRVILPNGRGSWRTHTPAPISH